MMAILCGYPGPCVGQSASRAEGERLLFRGAYRIWNGGLSVSNRFWDDCQRLVLLDGRQASEIVPTVLVPEARRKRRLPALTGSDAQSVILRFMATSPDGRWLLWPSLHDRNDADRGWSVRRLRGGEIRRWVADSSGSDAVWLPDSKGWVEFSPGAVPSKLTVHPLVKRHRAIRREVPGEAEMGTLLGITRRREAVFLGVRRLGPIRFFTIGVPPRNVVRRAFEVELPEGGRVRDLSLNRRGDRLGWILELPIDRHEYPDHEFWLSVWTSRLDGGRMRELGRYPSRRREEPSLEITHLKWTPDSRALTFAFQDELWGVRVR
jgi:hypothetical protein